MPANLPPEYFDAEKRYRQAKAPGEKVEILEEMLAIVPKHKGTDKLRADLRKRVSKLKSQAKKKKSPSRRDSLYAIDKEGAAQIAVIGPPNTGKSSLVSALTNAKPEIADFPHTTWGPSPGMIPFENIQFQLVDTPPLSREFMDQNLADLIRRADILLIVLDLHGDPLQQLEDTLYVLKERLRIYPEGQSPSVEKGKPPLIKKVLVAVNKMDGQADEGDYEVFLELSGLKLPSLGISIHSKLYLTTLVEKIYETSGIIRVYSRPPGKEPDLDTPFVLPVHSTMEDLASKIHKDLKEKLKFARVWGKEVYDGQMVQRDYTLQDGDVVEIHI